MNASYLLFVHLLVSCRLQQVIGAHSRLLMTFVPGLCLTEEK